jgi:hypothetical protein
MAEGNSISRIFAYLLLALAIVLSYQGWGNAQLNSATAALAKDHACDLDSSCIVQDAQARISRADVIRHRYEYRTTHGVMTVTCKRELLFFGEWSCVPAPGAMNDPRL